MHLGPRETPIQIPIVPIIVLGPSMVFQTLAISWILFEVINMSDLIQRAHEVLGANGWSSTVVSIEVDFIDETKENNTFNVGVTAKIRVTLAAGGYHEAIGYAHVDNVHSKGAAVGSVIWHTDFTIVLCWRTNTSVRTTQLPMVWIARCVSL